MSVIKRNGREVKFNFSKIKSGVSKAATQCGGAVASQDFKELQSLFDAGRNYNVEEIQSIVEGWLMSKGLHRIAKSFILYREEHKKARFVKERIAYIDKYVDGGKNASTSSETDPNANVILKNVANLEGEVYKLQNRQVQREHMFKKLTVMYPEVAKQYEKDLEHHIIYTHDESCSPVQKPYTYSPKESAVVKIDGKKIFSSLETIYSLSEGIQESPEDGVWIKRPSDSYVYDKDGNLTKILALTKRKRHRDLVRVKTSFGEDIVVTDNHPMIIGDTKDDTCDAINSEGETQTRVKNSISFEGIKTIDISEHTYYDNLSDNYICRHETSCPYFFAKRNVSMDRNFGYVVGFFIGDGNYDNTCHNLSFTQKDRIVLLKLSEYIFDAFGVISSLTLNGKDKWVLTVHSDIMFDIFKDYLKIKDKAWNKCIPYNILQFNEEFALGIIEGIIDSDGTISDNTISIRLSSRECITQLTMLLQYFGYGVSNSMQSTPFGNNKSYTSRYTIWGVQFAHSDSCVKLSNSFKFNKTNETSAYLKYSLGKTKITNVQSIENCSFLDQCDYIYDITTESNTFVCNNLWVHNCMAASLFPLMTEGVGNIDGLTPEPPNDIKSYSGQVTNLVFSLSSQVKGAVALGEYLVAMNYYVIAEFGDKWYEHLDDVVSTGVCRKIETVSSRIHDGFKQFIWGINQPAGNRSYQSPFTNVSYYDRTYFESLFADFRYPDGTAPEWKAVDTLQRMFMKFFNKLRLKAVLTFPVETLAMVYNPETGEIADKEYRELCAEMYAEGHSFFTYISDSADSLSSCCRLKNEIKENTFSPTSGMTGIMTGSCNVITLNFNRIVQDWYREVKTGITVDYIPSKEEIALQFGDRTSTWVQSLRQYICNILDRVYKYHIAYKTMLYELEEKGMYASSNAGYIYLKKLYSTVGINGLNEAARFFGLHVSNNEEYIHFLQFILSTVKDQNKLYSIQDKKRPFIFNSEVVPAEGLGAKNYNWDKADGYWVPEDENLYNSYFYNAHDPETTILDKFQLHGRQTFQYTDGGSALHCNLDSHLSKEQYLKLIDYAVKNGTSYFTFNIPNSRCNKCSHIVKQPICECPKCGSKDITQYTRVIGYLRPVTSFGADRQIEAAKRVYSSGSSEIPENGGGL